MPAGILPTAGAVPDRNRAELGVAKASFSFTLGLREQAESPDMFLSGRIDRVLRWLWRL
jgi:hypothetical protein